MRLVRVIEEKNLKITTWEQFSSNHSASYTVVGLLDTREDATHVGEIIQKMVVDIVGWYDQHRSIDKIFKDQESPIEGKYAKQYGFDWKESVDWMVHFPHRYEWRRDQFIHVYDRWVIVAIPEASISNQTGHQFVSMLDSLGATIFHQIEGGFDPKLQAHLYQDIKVNITCNAPNDEVAAQIQHNILEHLSNLEQFGECQVPIPWIIHHPYLEQVLGQLDANRVTEFEALWLKSIWAEDNIAPHQSTELPKTISEGIFDLRCDLEIFQADVKATESTVILENITGNFETLLPALLEWLQSFSCTDMTYSFHESGKRQNP